MKSDDTVRDLIVGCNIWSHFRFLNDIQRIYPDADRASYSRAIQEIVAWYPRPQPNGCTVKVTRSTTLDEVFVDYEDADGRPFALDWEPWELVLGMRYDTGEFCDREAAIHILWEMTFHGYSAADIDDARAQLELAISQLKYDGAIGSVVDWQELFDAKPNTEEG